MAAVTEVSPGPVLLLYEALLETGFSPDALSDLRSTIVDGAGLGGDGGDPQSLAPPGDVRASLLSAALSIVDRRGSPALVQGAAVFMALGFTPFASAALHNTALRSAVLWRAALANGVNPSAMNTAAP